MSSSAAAIREPRELALPPKVEKAFADLSPHLTNEGRKQFVSELFHALVESRKRNDLRPLQDAIETWYRTLLLRSDPQYKDNIRRAKRSSPKRGVPIEKLETRFSRR